MIEVKTRIDLETNKKLINFQMRKNTLLFIAATILLIVAGVLLIILKNYLAGSVVIVFGIIFVPGLVLITKIIQSVSMKNNSMPDEIINIMMFDDSFIKVETSKNGEKYSAKFSYDAFFRCYETKDNIFLFLKKNQAFVIPFIDITVGNSADLCALLKKKLKIKYKPVFLKKQS